MLVGLAGCLPTSLMKYPTITPVPQVAHVIENLVGIESVWVLNDVYIIWNEYDIAIDSLMGKTCFLGDLGKRGLYKNFICLESQSGQLLWIKETGVHRTIAVTLDGIFIAYNSPGALEKFDLNTGDLIWRKKLGGTGSTNLTYHKDQIQISTTNPEAL
jgi:outer membrane protein assembly factor BamB